MNFMIENKPGKELENNRSHYQEMARIMGFVSEKVMGYGDKDAICRNINTLAKTVMSDGIKYVVDENRINDYEWDLRDGIELGATVTFLSPEEYQQYIGALSDRKKLSINFITDKLVAYDQYRSKVGVLLKELDKYKKKSDHPEHISQDVFNIVIDGKECVVKYRPNLYDIGSILMGNSYIEGEDHFEQILAASIEDGVVVSEKIPGKQMNKMTVEEIVNIPDDHIRQCFESLLVAYQKGLPMENKGKNIMYDQKTGFGFIDFVSSFEFMDGEKKDSSKLLPYYFYPVFNGLVNLSGKYDWSPKTMEAIEKNLSAFNNSLSMANRIKPIVLEILANQEERDEMEKYVQKTIDYNNEKIRSYGNDDYIASLIKENS